MCVVQQQGSNQGCGDMRGTMHVTIGSLKGESCLLALQFVLKLMKERPQTIMDSINDKEHTVSPAALGHRIMITREALATGMKKFDFPTYMVRFLPSC
jgi:hypothetical protein